MISSISGTSTRDLEMTTTDREDLCRIIWNPSELDLDELVVLTSYVADLHNDVALPYALTRMSSLTQYTDGSGLTLPPPPRLVYCHLGSPLIADLVSVPGNSLSLLALGMLGYILKHPEMLGGWLSRVRGASYRSREVALKARADYLNAKASFDVQGRPVEVFEKSIDEGQN
jgi:hypothetical protein